MIDRNPNDPMPNYKEREVREYRETSSGASWLIAGLAIVVVLAGGLFMFGDDMNTGSDVTINNPPAAQQSEPPANAPATGEQAPASQPDSQPQTQTQ